MTDNFDEVNAFCSILKLDLSGSELANIAVRHNSNFPHEISLKKLYI